MDGSIEEYAAHLIPMGSVLLRTDEPFLSEVPCSQATFFTAAWAEVRMTSPPTAIIVFSKRLILVASNSVSKSFGPSGMGFAWPMLWYPGIDEPKLSPKPVPRQFENRRQSMVAWPSARLVGCPVTQRNHKNTRPSVHSRF